MHHLSADKELFRLFLCNLAGTLGFLLGAQALVLLQLAQLIGQCIRLAFHLLCQRTGLGTGSFQLVFALLDQFIPLFLSGLQLVRSLILQLLHLVLAFFQLQLQVVQLAQNCIQALILGRQMLLGCLNDTLRDAQLLTDEEGVGLAGHTYAQLVSRAQCLQIKLAAGIDYTLGFQRKHLQLGVVSGCHQQHTAAAQFLDDGHGQRCTFGRVSARAKLIQ